MKETILEEAIRITGGDRQEDYGDAHADADRFAQIASAATGLDVKAHHLPILLIALKLSRQYHKHKRDNLVDIAGYARVAEMISDAQ